MHWYRFTSDDWRQRMPFLVKEKAEALIAHANIQRLTSSSMSVNAVGIL
jgi:hypothetical protein